MSVMEDVPQRTKGYLRKYTKEQVDTALTVLATYGGSYKQAHDALLLLDPPLDVPVTTLNSWRTTGHRERYEQLAAEIAPQMEARIIESTRTAIDRSAQLEARLIDRLDDSLEDLKPADLAGALRNVTTTKGINTQNYLTLTGRPTNIVEHRDATDILRQLRESAPNLVIEGTAVEMPENTETPDNTPTDGQ